MRKLLIVLAMVLAAGLAAACGGADEESEATTFDLQAAREQLAGAPPALAELHEQSNELIATDAAGFQARLDELNGHPVVVNKWASWCGPCRVEFPAFQSQATERGKQVAFLGLNSGDSTGSAAKFLREHPVPFPSYEDPDEKIARAIGIPKNYPVTLFIDENGETAYIHQGQYADEADLAEDIERYLTPGGA